MTSQSFPERFPFRKKYPEISVRISGNFEVQLSWTRVDFKVDEPLSKIGMYLQGVSENGI